MSITPSVPQPHDADTLRIERGNCHVVFAHDMALSIDLNQAERLITATTARQTIRHKRRAPQYFEYDPPPLRVTQDIEPVTLGPFRTTALVDIIIYDFGAVSVTYCIPLHGPLSDLLPLSNDLYANEALLADSRHRVRQLLETIAPAVSKPQLSNLVEDYAIYQIEQMAPSVERSTLVDQHGELLARILRAEHNALSKQETGEALACQIAYSQDDLLIVDWNAALLFDTAAEDVRAVMEFANVELLEMRYLDDRLDDALDESHEKLTRRGWNWLRTNSSTRDLNRIAELQVDGALLFEGVNNALKLLGDQYLARVYRMTSQRLHLNEWDASILRKLQTLDSIYHKLSDQQSTRRMELLEWIIIILIAVSIILPFVLPGSQLK